MVNYKVLVYPFVHFLQHGVVVCSECKHAVLPSHIDAYLKNEGKHKAVKALQQPRKDRLSSIWI